MRIFIAIPPAPHVMQTFKSILHDLAILYPEKLRLITPEKLHLTLQFIAEFKAEDLRSLIYALQKISLPESKIFIEMQRKLLLPHAETARVLAYRVKKNRYLLDLQFQVAQCIKDLGYSLDAQGFLPHFTLARSLDKHLLQKIDLPLLDSQFVFNELVIYESIQQDGDFVYRPLEIISFNVYQ